MRVSRVCCEIRLAAGNWINPPTRARVRKLLNTFIRAPNNWVVCVEEIDSTPSDGVVLQVTVCVRWMHSEIVRDRIIEAVLRYCQPEYDSMVEVAVIDIE